MKLYTWLRPFPGPDSKPQPDFHIRWKRVAKNFQSNSKKCSFPKKSLDFSNPQIFPQRLLKFPIYGQIPQKREPWACCARFPESSIDQPSSWWFNNNREMSSFKHQEMSSLKHRVKNPTDYQSNFFFAQVGPLLEFKFRWFYAVAWVANTPFYAL